MTNLLSFTVHGTPKPKGSLRHIGHGRMVEQVNGSKEWRETVAWAARQAHSGPALDGPLIVTAIVYLPRPKTNRDAYPTKRWSGDSDKHARNINDALVDAGVIVDDSLIIDSITRKRFADHCPPGAHIAVMPVREGS